MTIIFRTGSHMEFLHLFGPVWTWSWDILVPLSLIGVLNIWQAISSRQHQQMVLSENRVSQNFMVIKCYNHHFPNFILMFPNFPYQICHFFGAFGAIWASSSRGHRGHRADGLTFSLQLLHKVGAQSTLPRTPGATPGTPQGQGPPVCCLMVEAETQRNKKWSLRPVIPAKTIWL